MEQFNNKNPFKTPEDYFEGFDGKLLEKLGKENFPLPNNDGFGVPKGYFDALNQDIRQRLDAAEVKVIPLKSYKQYFYMAASVAAIALVLLGLNWKYSEEISFEDLANTEIETYFEDNELGLNTYEIAEVIPIDELEINDILENRFDEENVLDYLNDNLDDFEVLNLEDDE